MYDASTQKEFIQRGKVFLQHPEKVSSDQLPILRKLLRFHEWKYYVKDNPVISDFEYDMLFKILERIEAAHPDLITPDSPTQRVGSDLSSDFPTVSHLSPMLSLENSYNADDLKDFEKQVRKLTGEENPITYVVEPKFDGSSVALIYENNYLVRGATRGNGLQGDDITPNIKTMPTVPLSADFSARGIHKVELRGEALIRKDYFEAINEQRAKEELPLFANPRNAAAGGLRMKDPKEAAQRKLDTFIYQLTYAEDAEGRDATQKFSTHSEMLQYLSEIGFLIPNDLIKVCKNISEVIDFCQEAERNREQYPYEIDGMVVKVNRLDLQQKCGLTAHHPRWAIAYKFKAKQETSILEDVVFQVGKVGAITPVAKIKPIELAGVTVSSVSLHNEEFIRSKDIRIGDHLVVERAGDVIPYIVKSLPELRDNSVRPIVFPELCPSCQTPLVKEEDMAAWRCPNYHCPEQVIQRMIHFVSKNAMNIDGMGESQIRKFHDLGWLNNFDDIYRLPFDEIQKLDGFGQRSVENLKKAIEMSKNNPIHRLLYGLSIHHLGRKASKLIAGQIKHLLDLKDWEMERLTAINEIGPILAGNIIAFFKIPENVSLLQSLEALGVNLNQKEEDRPKALPTDGPLSGKTILFTGKLVQMNRKEAQDLAEKAGAKNISAVSKNLNILVAGEKAGSKLKKAKALGTVDILSEQEFLDLVNGMANG